MTELHYATLEGNVPAIELLLAQGVDVNAHNTNIDGLNNTPLHIASRNGHVAATELLIANGAKVDALSMDRVRPLHVAARAGVPRGQLEIIKLLLDNGADVNAFDKFKFSPLHYSAMEGYHIATMRLLLAEGANRYAANIKRHTPLDLYKGRDDRILCLLAPKSLLI